MADAKPRTREDATLVREHSVWVDTTRRHAGRAYRVLRTNGHTVSVELLTLGRARKENKRRGQRVTFPVAALLNCASFVRQD